LFWEFVPLDTIVETITGHRLVICGNTGIGWVAGVVETPLLACEKADAMAFGEYSFAKCSVEALRAVIVDPSVEQTVRIVLAELDRQ
jgi:hypothetical protein